MDKLKEFNRQIHDFQNLDMQPVSVEKKLDELIFLLEKSDLDTTLVQRLQIKFNSAVEKVKVTPKELVLFKALDNVQASRSILLDNLENLLLNHEVDSDFSRNLLVAEGSKRISIMLISLIMITVGFALIIMPAPSYFEGFILFNLQDNKVSMMDLISLLVVFTGVYLFITSIIKINKPE